MSPGQAAQGGSHDTQQARPIGPGEPIKGDKLSAELAWFHVFKAMIDDGEVAKIGASAFTTYCVIKSHTNFATGVAFPSIETISEKSCIGYVVGYTHTSWGLLFYAGVPCA
jgi:hypothetical protein